MNTPRRVASIFRPFPLLPLPSLSALLLFLIPLAANAADPSGSDIHGPLFQGNSGLAGFTAYQNAAVPTPAELATNLAHVFFSVNFAWTLLCGFLVMFMQTGFALVETGLVRAKNAVHTMGMNILVYALGMAGFFACGYALMCGGANGTAIGGPANLGGIPVLDRMATLTAHGTAWGLFGKVGFFLSGAKYDASSAVWFLFMMVFMDTAATIPTGALAERWKLKSFCIMSVLIGAVIYPVYGCWLWGGGWLSQLGLGAGLGHGAVDFAGSSVVHLQGGVFALVMTLMLGARVGKFGADGKPRTIPAHNVPMVVIGTLILAFGWFGFNAGSTLGASDGRIGVIATNTMLASGSAALSALFYHWSRYRKPDVVMSCNGMLAGLVAITAPCAFVAPWAAFVIGLVAGVLVIVSCYAIEKLGIDDPVGAISVHGVNGIWGMLALGLFADGTYGSGWNGVGATSYLGTAGRGVTGLFYGDISQFWAQSLSCVACIVWCGVVCAALFKLTGLVVGGNRVSAEDEERGLDLAEIGLPAYVSGESWRSNEELAPDLAFSRRSENSTHFLRLQTAQAEESVQNTNSTA